MRLMDKNDFLDLFYVASAGQDKLFVNTVEMVVEDTPTIDAVPVVHGRWVDRYYNKYANPLYQCSECEEKALYRFEVDALGREIAVQDLSDYCPNCGARMDGATEGGADS